MAIAEGRALADSLFGPAPRQVDLRLVASAVFTTAADGNIGPSETDALAAGHRLRIFEADFRPMRQAFIDGAERGYMKLLVDADTDKVLAVHMLGADAPEIVQSLAVALTCGRHQGRFRPHDRRAPDRRRRIRADARGVANGRLPIASCPARPWRGCSAGEQPSRRRRACGQVVALQRRIQLRQFLADGVEGVQRDRPAGIVDQVGVHVLGQRVGDAVPGRKRLVRRPASAARRG